MAAVAVMESNPRHDTIAERRSSRTQFTSLRQSSRPSQATITFAPRPVISNGAPEKSDRRSTLAVVRRVSRAGLDGGGVHFPPITGRRASVVKPGLVRRPSLLGGFPTLGGKLQSRVPVEEPVEYFDDSPQNLPKEPRFCATMSREAQYASLKGYEDVLFQKLQDTYPDYETLLSRTKTPAFNEVLSRLKSAEDKKQQDTSIDDLNDEEMLMEERRIRRRRERERRKREVEEEQNKNKENNEADKEQNEKAKTEPPPKNETLRRVSYRFQNAIDILDTLKHSTGELVTSSVEDKIKKEKMNPLHGYNCWTTLWTKQFNFQKGQGDRLPTIHQ